MERASYIKETKKNKNYELLVYDAKTVGKVILGLEAIDIANVYIDSAEYSKIEDLKIKLKQKAITKAKLQAESLLKPLNQNLGKAIYISDSNMNITHRLRGKALGVNVRSFSSIQEASTESLNIDFEKIKVESTVNVNFIIE
ncbi:SIMPL domain-containing protein [Aquimarina rhabdastrellae]